MFLAMFDVSVEDFLSPRPTSVPPRPEAWFPCLNPLCPRQGDLVIRESEVKRGQDGKLRIYLCPHCGHRSSRLPGGLIVYHVSSYGHLWEQKLRALWSSKSKSLGAIAAELKSTFNTVRCHAAKLQLPFPRHGPRRPAGVGFLKKFATRVAPHNEKPRSCASFVVGRRARWLALREENPLASRTELCRLSPHLYYWLRTHDRDWYQEHSPERRFPRRTKPDWSVRDKDLERRVTTAADRIKRRPGNPRRVTVAAIAYELGLRGNLYSRLKRLPLTALALGANIESTEQFALRRIRQAVDTCFIQDQRATRCDLTRVARIHPGLYKKASIRRAIIDAIDELDIRVNTARLSVSHGA